jgi:hypothetical protein
VAYRGPETVCQLLQRTGGIKPGAAPDEVYLVRSRVPDGRQPEVFPVKLADIVLRKDDQTNITLQPFDQIFVGQTSQACLGKCVPPCFKPFYKAAFGLNRPPQPAPPPEATATEPPARSLRLLPLRKGRPPATAAPLPEPPEPPPLPPPRRIL